MINYNNIEKKWQKAWEDAKLFEAEQNDAKPIFITAAFPYINAPLHIGHVRTYGTADMYARYMRMQGYNVLFPMGVHATGTPVLAFAKRIAQNDKDLIETLKIFSVADEDIQKMSDPKYIIDYFTPKMEEGMRRAGLSIDWRRKFISIEPLFSKMVEWQFMQLKQRGFLTKGKHPVGWCTNENNAVGQHDTKHDVQPDIEQMSVIMFKDRADDTYFVCATYRPETIYGVTNIFVNKDAQYLIAWIANGNSMVKCYISKSAADILSYQQKIQVIATLSGAELLSKSAINPVTKEELPVFHGFFVKENIGTGIVMSVPAHAPFDYAALQRLKASGQKIDIESKKIIDIQPSNGISIGRSLNDVIAGDVAPQHPEIPALAYLEILHTNADAIDDMLEFATKLAYREESHWGIMSVGQYKGMREPEAREAVKRELVRSECAFMIYALANSEQVICRCGTNVIIKIVDDQWFINYSDQKWKKTVREHLKNLRIYPAVNRAAIENTVEWIEERAAERAQGFGTKFPFNKEHIIESLSDSTIYMIFYTFVNIIRSAQLKPEQLNTEFFDYLFNNIGSTELVAKSTAIDEQIVKRCKDSVDYWYTNTSSHSGNDLVQNHLTMYIFNHVALLPEKFWPDQIVINGLVTYEGEKMSKSLGNIIPLVDGIEKYGADPLRFLEISGADLDTETEFNTESWEGVVSRNDYLYGIINNMHSLRGGELKHIDFWLYSKLNSKIKKVTDYMDGFYLRKAYTEAYYDAVSELRHYFDRGGSNQIVVREFLESIVLMMAPIMPHVAEEFWSALGRDVLIAREKWPKSNQEMVNYKAETIEEIISNTVDDINRAISLTSKANPDKKVGSIRIIIADDWKRVAYNILADKKNIADVMQSEQFVQLDKALLSKFISQFSKRITMLIKLPDIESQSVYASFSEAAEQISKKFAAKIIVEIEATSKSERASRALPEKPAIDIIWG